jgi:hypothetical protein
VGECVFSLPSNLEYYNPEKQSHYFNVHSAKILIDISRHRLNLSKMCHRDPDK